MKKRKLALGLACACLALTLAAGASYAYLRDQGKITNAFSSQTIGVKVSETGWKTLPDGNNDGVPDAASALLPGKEIPKDPAARNESSAEAWCFLQVDVPVKDVMLIGSAPDVTKNAELFTFTPNLGWKLLSSQISGGVKSYVYGYTFKVKAHDTTPTLFDSVTFTDVAQGQIGGGDMLDIHVSGTAIQAQGFATVDEAFAALE